MNDVVLLTGATGFVGRQVLRGLSKQGAQVRLVVRDEKQGELVSQGCVESLVHSPDVFAEDAAWWAKVCRGVDIVIHVAWYAEPGKYLQSAKNLDCLIGTLQMARGAVQAGVRRFIGVGTCFEYELSTGILSEESPLQPLTPYAGSKAAVFMALSQCLPQQGVEFAWCRLFYLYGEGEDARRLVPYLHSNLAAGQPVKLTGGKQIRDFLNVREAGQMIAETALGHQQGPVNICSGTAITVRQLAERIADEYGRRDLLEFGARPDNFIDPPCIVGARTKEQPRDK
jgi:dTDP-6-deoxy-L-talose 4-dehydrogenase (NAD+)